MIAAAGDRWEEGEVVTILQDMVRRLVLAVDDLEKSDRPGDLEDSNDVIDRRVVGKIDRLLIRSEGPQ